ncbi:hypothetical protein BU14_0218s0015 [Porphyra umbilicalis]|uniref:Uncharacterized protein n=1 Tax=Porphyra umbilicalis TaxID=2786 RepID=A0A1X6P4N4_PORUM|nr:hypothetical protein BU14_0218s0015 [Porphyra umbilicalis]|eukprot:OSX75849.1 hypothetical protein BU14_0218s0015 [Porphyra umbilicalis]
MWWRGCEGGGCDVGVGRRRLERVVKRGGQALGEGGGGEQSRLPLGAHHAPVRSVVGIVGGWPTAVCGGHAAGGASGWRRPARAAVRGLCGGQGRAWRRRRWRVGTGRSGVCLDAAPAAGAGRGALAGVIHRVGSGGGGWVVHAAEGALWSFGLFRQQADRTICFIIALPTVRCAGGAVNKVGEARVGSGGAGRRKFEAATRPPEADLPPARTARYRSRRATGAKATVQAIPAAGAPLLPDAVRPVTDAQACKRRACPSQRPLASRTRQSRPHAPARRRCRWQRCRFQRREFRLLTSLAVATSACWDVGVWGGM